MTSIDDFSEIETDLANLARLSSSGANEDVRLLVAKLVRKYRTLRPALAEQLDSTLKASRTRSHGPAVLRRSMAVSDSSAMPMDADSRQSLIRVFDDLDGISEPLLPDALFAHVQSLIRERRERDRLAAHGIRPTRSAILVGPPGVGKTLSARWIANQLGKPLWVLDLTTVMSSLLGKTGSNLRAVFDHAKQNQAVLLLDEIDAIAKRRSDESDVGELKRLVTAILQEVDAWPDSGLLLAATNHPELIDPALWRRFDAVLTFETPQGNVLATAVRRFLGADIALFEKWVDLLASSVYGMSLSDVERSINALRRYTVLENASPAHAVIEMAIKGLPSLDKSSRQKLAIELARLEALSHNKIMELTGVSRDTIRKYAGPSPIKGRGIKKKD
ncbi:ATP-binding protein [Limnohabitans sp. MORI2]|uniref:AAA family ATPase n=1 Tax=Limnohabitans sp. MORI2 TaxID=1751150 RepID=UPI00248F5CF9|nr:ATP-binding protein [Limnohabitans sp. MORI2]